MKHSNVANMLETSLVTPTSVARSADLWNYDEAFSRNRGLLTEHEQSRLRSSRIAIAGLGGVGGVHLMTLARLGIGAFNIADPDRFEVANFNRQCGAVVPNIGRPKVDAMVDEVRQINPDVDLRVFKNGVSPENVEQFLDGVDIFVDGIDFFSFDARRLAFQEARKKGIWSVTAGPLGFSTAWLVFSPDGMTFDDYFDLHDQMDIVDRVAALAVGLCPRATHFPYLDLSQVNLSEGSGPSAGLACQLCSGVCAAEVMKILLAREHVRPVPWFFQFDAYRHILRKGRLPAGNRHPLQRLKRWWLTKQLRTHGAVSNTLSPKDREAL